jgi:hypothetical protein
MAHSSYLYHCGIDIGTKNMSIAFIPILSEVSAGARSQPSSVIAYKGTPIEMDRYEVPCTCGVPAPLERSWVSPTQCRCPSACSSTGNCSRSRLWSHASLELDQEVKKVYAYDPNVKILKKDMNQYGGFIKLLNNIPEFKHTISAVIELQVNMNCSEMIRFDGIAYGFLKGAYPSMFVNLNGATIRKGFITKRLAEIDPTIIASIYIPKGIKDTKLLSCQYAGYSYPAFYTYICTICDKADDICDAIVYAHIGAFNMK